MSTKLRIWATTERQFLREELAWYKAGGQLLSPSKENITLKKVTELEARLKHAEQAIAEADLDDGSQPG